jgi:hypothetical protein
MVAFGTRTRLLKVMLIFATPAAISWIIYLGIDLPEFYRAQNWDVAWIGFDGGLLVAVFSTFLAIIKERQVAIPLAVVSGTLLVVDSWFDTANAQGGRDFYFALALALLVQIPFAFLLFRFGRRAMHQSLVNSHRKAGLPIPKASLLKTPLAIFREE